MLIDSHAHIDLPDFAQDRDEVLARARQQGVTAIINIGINLESSRESIHIAQRYPDVFTSVGFHPNDTAQLGEGDLGQLAGLTREAKVVAIGETGLDFYRKSSPRQRQLDAFHQQLALAAELRLPIIIHSRNANQEVWDILSRWAKSTSPPADRRLRGVIHCFSGDVELARCYIELGFLISLAGSITFPRALDRVRVVQGLPLDKLLVETDSPFLAPQLHRGRRNEPSYIPLIVERLAQVTGISAEKVARVTAQNAIELFRLPEA